MIRDMDEFKKEYELKKLILEADRDIDSDGKDWENYNRGRLNGLLLAYNTIFDKDLNYWDLEDMWDLEDIEG